MDTVEEAFIGPSVRGAWTIYTLLCRELSQFRAPITVVYTRNELIQRKQLWHYLPRLGTQVTETYIFIGDFNNVLSSDDKTEHPINLAEVQRF